MGVLFLVCVLPLCCVIWVGVCYDVWTYVITVCCIDVSYAVFCGVMVYVVCYVMWCLLCCKLCFVVCFNLYRWMLCCLLCFNGLCCMFKL